MTKLLKKTIGTDPINTGRQIEVDIAKGLAIIFMVWCHCFIMLTPNEWNTPILIVDGILGGPFAAPVFMFCVGIGVCYSKKNTPKDCLKRGLILLGLGLLLNVFRSILPDFIRYLITGSTHFLYDSIYYSVLSVDILQFAGLAFLFISLCKKLKFNNYVLFVIAIAFSLLGTYLRRAHTGHDIIDGLLGYLWGSNPETFFPFLNWIIFPVFGMIFGSFLIRCKDKCKLYLLSSTVSGFLLVIYMIFILPDKQWHSVDAYYYFLDTVDAVAFTFLTIACLGIYYALSQILKRVSFKTLSRFSKHITAIYCIHWTILGNLTLVLRFILRMYELQFWQVTLIAALLLGISDLIAIFYYKKLKRKFARKSSTNAKVQ